MMEHHCFITTILPGKAAAYVAYHDAIWPEVPAGLLTAGLTGLRIYRVPQSDTIILNITTAEGIDLAAATGPGSPYRAVARCEEWENLMDADFHGGWTKCAEIHSSDNWPRTQPRGEGVTFFDDDEELNWGEPGFKRQELRKKIKALDKAIDEGIDKVTAPFRKVNPLLLLAAGVAGGMAATRLIKK